MLSFCINAAVFCRRRGREGALKGSGFTLDRVGEGKSGVSSSSSEYARVGSHLARGRLPSAKRFLPEPDPEVRRGDKESEAIEIGEGSPICTSTGESITVLERLNGVRVSRFCGLFPLDVGDSSDS